MANTIWDKNKERVDMIGQMVAITREAGMRIKSTVMVNIIGPMEEVTRETG